MLAYVPVGLNRSPWTDTALDADNSGKCHTCSLHAASDFQRSLRKCTAVPWNAHASTQ